MKHREPLSCALSLWGIARLVKVVIHANLHMRLELLSQCKRENPLPFCPLNLKYYCLISFHTIRFTNQYHISCNVFLTLEKYFCCRRKSGQQTFTQLHNFTYTLTKNGTQLQLVVAPPGCLYTYPFIKTHIYKRKRCAHILLQVVDLLIASGADVQHLDQDGRTSLGLACLTGNIDIVKTFLEMGWLSSQLSSFRLIVYLHSIQIPFDQDAYISFIDDILCDRP